MTTSVLAVVRQQVAGCPLHQSVAAHHWEVQVGLWVAQPALLETQRLELRTQPVISERMQAVQ
jgi:hypothetical protein